MNAIKLVLGVFFTIFAIVMLLLAYNYAVAPVYGFPTIWGDN